MPEKPPVNTLPVESLVGLGSPAYRLSTDEVLTLRYAPVSFIILDEAQVITYTVPSGYRLLIISVTLYTTAGVVELDVTTRDGGKHILAAVSPSIVDGDGFGTVVLSGLCIDEEHVLSVLGTGDGMGYVQGLLVRKVMP